MNIYQICMLNPGVGRHWQSPQKLFQRIIQRLQCSFEHSDPLVDIFSVDYINDTASIIYPCLTCQTFSVY